MEQSFQQLWFSYIDCRMRLEQAEAGMELHQRQAAEVLRRRSGMSEHRRAVSLALEEAGLLQ